MFVAILLADLFEEAYELVKEYTGETLAVVLLLLLFKTDLPKVFFNLLEGLYRKTTQTPKLARPLRRSSIYPLYAKIAFERRKKIILAQPKRVLEQKLKTVSFLHSKIHSAGEKEHAIRVFPSRTQSLASRNLFAVVQGLPGAGKSTFVLNHLKKMTDDKSADYIFFLDYRTIIQALEAPEDDIPAIWKLLHAQVLRYTLNGEPPLSHLLLSYVMNYKAVYILIEDIPDLFVYRHILLAFKTYISQFHPKNKSVRIVLTTRINSGLRYDDMPDYVEIPVRPLEKTEVETYFYGLCQSFSIDLQTSEFFDALASSKSLLRFELPLTKTPLFVEILVLTIKDKGFKFDNEEFLSSINRLYKAFMRTLFDTSKSFLDYTRFYAAYRELGYFAWINNLRVFNSSLVTRFFGPINVPLTFLITNGFLIEDESELMPMVTFVHQSVCDMLFVEQMLVNNDFSSLTQEYLEREEYVYYLKGAIRDIDSFAALVQTNLLYAVKILDAEMAAQIRLQNSVANSQKLVQVLLKSHFINLQSAEQDVAILLDKILVSASGLDNYLIAQLIGQVLSRRQIKILSCSQRPSLHQYLVAKVIDEINHLDLIDLLEENYLPLVQRLSDELLTGDSDTPSKVKLIRVLLSKVQRGEARQVFIKIFIDNLAKFREDDLRDMLADETLRNGIFFRQYTNKDTSFTKKISALLPESSRFVYLPKGNYFVYDKTIVNSRSALVPINPEQILVIAKDTYEAQMKALTDIQYQLMTFDQLRIAYCHFQKNGLASGLIGLNSKEAKDRGILYEAYKENFIGPLGFAFIPPKDISVPMPKPQDPANFVQNLYYRRIQLVD
jgi:hypothetical protein